MAPKDSIINGLHCTDLVSINSPTENSKIQVLFKTKDQVLSRPDQVLSRPYISFHKLFNVHYILNLSTFKDKKDKPLFMPLE